MTNLAEWSLVIGFFSPLVISVLQQTGWPKEMRAVVTLLYSIVVAGPTAYFAGNLTGKDFVSAGLLIMVSAISTYQGLWSKVRVTASIERATTLPFIRRRYQGEHEKRAA